MNCLHEVQGSGELCPSTDRADRQQRGMQLLPAAHRQLCVCVCLCEVFNLLLLLYHGLLLWFLSLWTLLFSTQRRGKGGNSDMEPIDKWLITQGMVRTSPVKRFLLPTPVPLPRITILHSPLVLPYWTTKNQTVQGVYFPPTSLPGAKGKICTDFWFIQHEGL